MRVVIVGAGEVGFHIAERLAREGHDVTVVERSEAKEREIRAKLNALVVRGSGASAEVLEQADVGNADLFIAVTDLDEVNLVACMLANQLGVPRRIARIKSAEFTQSEWTSNAQKPGIDLVIDPGHVVAEEIVDMVSYPAATEVAEFEEGKVVFLGYPIGRKSPVSGITLKELGDLREIYRLVVTALSRGPKTIIPRGGDEILEGDVLYFVTKRDDLAAVNYLFGFDKRSVRSVFVLGGGRVGAEVARKLAAQGLRVKVVERNAENCEQIARTLDSVTVLNTEGTDVDTLRSEGIEQGDVFIAVTQDDRTNILCSLLAKSLGVKRAVCLVNKAQWIPLAASLGINACVSPRLASAGAILKYVRRAKIVDMAFIERCDAEVVEMVLPEEGGRWVGKLSEIHLPQGAIIGAIVRGKEVIIPTGADRLQGGDRVIVFALPDAVSRVERFFS